MNPLILAVQLVLPLVLLVWLGIAPAGGKLSYFLQVLAVFGTLAGITLGGLWMMLPFWLPYLYLFLLVIIVCLQIFTAKGGGQEIWSVSVSQSILLCLTLLLSAAGMALFVLALLGRIPPKIESLDIASPFADGTYLVASGGSNVIVNPHLKTLDPEVERFRDWQGQSRALDLIKINAMGFRVDGWSPENPERYITFGQPVLAPCAGRVALVVDGIHDNKVPVMNREAMAGNFVAIECTANRFVILAHFRKDSLSVVQGQQVKTGDYLGEMGNSGNSSEPHLHIHAQRGLPANTPLAGEPLVLTINGRYLVRNDRFGNDATAL